MTRSPTSIGYALHLAKRVAYVLLGAVGLYVAGCTLALIAYTTVMPPITGVQLQRAVEAQFITDSYTRVYHPVSVGEISPHVPRAVVAAEDGRFFTHGGIDWEAIQEARAEHDQGRRLRGGSTITQQLVKNLFMTTHRSYLRKAMEVPLTYLAELILSKERILHLYVNVVEWGPGIYGVSAASDHHFAVSADALTRRQAAGLAACLPAPRSRTPQVMYRYTTIIEQRMTQHGW